MHRFLAFLFICFPFQAFASFSGNYSGKGQAVSHPQEKVRACSQIFLSMKTVNKTLSVLQGGYSCGDMQASYPSFSLQIVGTKLVSEGTVVGTYSDSEIDLYKEDKSEGYTFHLQLKKSANTIAYREDWTDGGKPALTILGPLKLVP